mmetsp:Transcript_33800/g.54081  ORF Transcript_33800/g.54081 Transcript_33800/m.54081 type:complete len:237 (+) Transcript_33800:316-1026(+)
MLDMLVCITQIHLAIFHQIRQHEARRSTHSHFTVHQHSMLCLVVHERVMYKLQNWFEICIDLCSLFVIHLDLYIFDVLELALDMLGDVDDARNLQVLHHCFVVRLAPCSEIQLVAQNAVWMMHVLHCFVFVFVATAIKWVLLIKRVEWLRQYKHFVFLQQIIACFESRKHRVYELAQLVTLCTVAVLGDNYQAHPHFASQRHDVGFSAQYVVQFREHTLVISVLWINVFQIQWYVL